MHARHVLALLVCALLAPACLAPVESPCLDDESPGNASLPFESSLFQFSVLVPDDHQGESGGMQRSITVLKFADARDSWWHPDRWECRIRIDLPIRHHVLGVITPGHAAELSADATTEAASAVMHARPKWIAALYCPLFVTATQAELNKTNLGARTGST